MISIKYLGCALDVFLRAFKIAFEVNTNQALLDGWMVDSLVEFHHSHTLSGGIL